MNKLFSTAHGKLYFSFKTWKDKTDEWLDKEKRKAVSALTVKLESIYTHHVNKAWIHLKSKWYEALDIKRRAIK